MAHPATLARSQPVALRDLLALTKPRVTRLVVFTAAVGMWLAPTGSLTVARVVAALVGTVLVVASANTLNMYLERDIDGLMGRTAARPLPGGRMHSSVALGFGLGLALFALPILSLAVNPLTSLLGATALALYVWGYTPLKQHTWLAVIVGAVPGAMPPLMGWTAATGTIGAPGLALFLLMFFWQVPHTIAITLFRDAEYRKAGFVTLPIQRGFREARMQTALWTVPVVASSLLPVLLGFAGGVYAATAAVLGAAFLTIAVKVWLEQQGTAWAKRLFVFSIGYVTVLLGMLLATAGHVHG